MTRTIDDIICFIGLEEIPESKAKRCFSEGHAAKSFIKNIINDFNRDWQASPTEWREEIRAALSYIRSVCHELELVQDEEIRKHLPLLRSEEELQKYLIMVQQDLLHIPGNEVLPKVVVTATEDAFRLLA